MFLEGSSRIWPSWEIRLWDHTVSPLFWPTVVLPGIMFTLAAVYPFLEARLTGDRAEHHLLQRPRDVPVRTSLGMMALSFYIVLFVSGGNDIISVSGISS
jgi:ubiquinol-cytochrome c reductase cytochrome b subunit